MRNRRSRLAIVLLAISLASLAALASPAVALAATKTGPATWTEAAPADGSSVGAVRPPISVKAYDPAGIMGSPYYSLKVDNKLQSATFTRVDGTHVGFSFTPRADLANGSHTVVASVRNNVYAYSTYTWTFTVSSAPKLSAPSPAPGSTVSTDGPTISVSVGGMTTGLVAQVLVDGTAVPGSFDAGTGLVSASTARLANDASHDVTVTVTNSSGATDRLAWSFGVEIYGPMPVPDVTCPTCHAGFPDAHPMTNCLACHGPGSPVGEGWNVPDYAPHSSSYIARTPTSCVDCHSAGYSTVPALHSLEATAGYHDSAAACSPCHVRSLTTEHNRYGKTCSTCHASTDPLVTAAIAAKNTACDACHPGAASHELAHEITPVPCNDCHAGTSLTAIHINSGTSLTCDTCHKSADPNVTGAIAGGDKSCSACHVTDGVDYHTSAVSKHRSPTTSTCFGTGCHAASQSLPDVHALYAGAGSERPQYASACTMCHKNPSVETSTAGSVCSGACHPEANHHENMPTKHAVTSASDTCTGCHGTDITDIHGAYTDLTRCGLCHTQVSNWSKTGDCGNCHTGPQHPDAAAKHVGDDTDAAGYGCSTGAGTPAGTCHDITDVSALHANVHDGSGGCVICHGPGKTPTTVCRTCHLAGSETGIYHHNNVRYLNESTDATPGAYYADEATAVNGWNDDLEYYDCQYCHTDYGWTTPMARKAITPYQGATMWHSGLGSDFTGAPVDSGLTLAAFTVPPGGALDFMTYYATEQGFDYGYVEVSTDGGTTWSGLPGNITTTADPNGQNSGNGITGDSAGWVSAHFDLSAYAGQSVKLRFHYVTDAASFGPGWAIDSVSVSGSSGTVFSDDAETLKPEWTPDGFPGWRRTGRYAPPLNTNGL